MSKILLRIKQALLSCYLHTTFYTTQDLNRRNSPFFQGKELGMVRFVVLYGTLTTFTGDLKNESDGNEQWMLYFYRFLLKMSIRSDWISHRDRVIVPSFCNHRTYLKKRSCRKQQHECHSGLLAGSRPSTGKARIGLKSNRNNLPRNQRKLPNLSAIWPLS